MGSVFVAIMKIVWMIASQFISNEAKKAEWEKKIKEQTDKYNKGVGDSAKIREKDQELKKKVEEEWQKKWGKKES